ncbi:MAG: YbaK/EbsC family protein [Acidobacteriota bacterium]
MTSEEIPGSPDSPDCDPAWGRVRAALQDLGVTYEPMACDPDFADTAAFCQRYGIRPEESANTILVASRQEPKAWSASLVLSHTRLDVNHVVRRLMGAKRISFASGEETVAKTGMMIGGVSLFGLPPDIPIYVDSRVMDAPRVVIGGGSRSWKVLVAPSMLLRLPGVSVVPGLAGLRSDS